MNIKINYHPNLSSDPNCLTSFSETLINSMAEIFGISIEKSKLEKEKQILEIMNIGPLFWNNSKLLTKEIRDELYNSLMPKIPYKIKLLYLDMIRECLIRLNETYKGTKNLGVFEPGQELDCPPLTLDKNGEYQVVSAVFNTANGNGSHWVCMVATCDSISYFDPLGFKPNKKVHLLIQQTLDMISGDDEVNVFVNSEHLQKDNSACGFYAISFIEYFYQNPSGSIEEWRKLDIRDHNVYDIKNRLFNPIVFDESD